jgi:hypothetical protein
MKKIILFVFLGLTNFAFCQSVLQNNPTYIKWYQVNTPHFRVLFPKGFDVQAQRVANTLEHLHEPEAKSMGDSPKKISVILQNQSSLSNGFVTILPRRSEFYTMPAQDYNFLGTNDWLNLLASHEYRHIVQYQHATRGFNKLFYYLFGNPTLAGMSHVAAPLWFWEGDAVATETAFTPSGRGRIPNFGLVFKTNLLEGRTFNYHKQYLRSYKHNIPNHYVLGYYMISYLRRKTNDPDIWGKITARSWSVPFIPFAFSNAIKHESGMYVTQLYREMAETFKREWQAEIDSLQLTSFDKVNLRTSKAYTDYRYPQPLPDGSVLVMKSGIGDIEKFVLFKEGREQKVFTPGFINDAGMLSVQQNTLVWNEYGYDPRWPVKNYSLIKAYDLNKGQRVVVSDHHARLGAAALSSDGTRIVTVRSDNNYQHRILVIDYASGTIVKEYPNPDNYFFAMPRFTPDGDVVVLKTTSRGKTLTIIRQDGTQEDLLPETNENIGHPFPFDRYILFSSPDNGIDNIFALDRQTKERYQITTSKYGAYSPTVSADGKYIYYNEQVRDGLDAVRISFDPAQWKPYRPQRAPHNFYEHLVKQEGHAHLLDSVPQNKLVVKRYSKFKGMINPYSWGAFVTSNLTQGNVGIASQDILSTTSLSAGYTYDINERTGFWNANASYQGFFPIIDVSFREGRRKITKDDDYQLFKRYITRSGDTTTTVTNQKVKFEWKEQNVEAGVRIPLNLTNSRFSTQFIFGHHVGYTRVSDFQMYVNGEKSSSNRYLEGFIQYDTIIQNGKPVARQSFGYYTFFDYIGNGNLIYNTFTISASRLLKQSRRDIYSKWGQALYVTWYSTPFGGDYTGNQFSAYGVGYFPGLFKHHSIYGYLGYQHAESGSFNPLRGEGLNTYYFRNQIPLPRGQSVSRYPQFISMSANYTLPMWYPDIAIGPLVNIQRVRLNVFYDYAVGSAPGRENQVYASTGGEVRFDVNILRLLSPQLNVGFRYSYGLKPSVTKYEFLLGTINF